jgi:hypothetical protein
MFLKPAITAHVKLLMMHKQRSCGLSSADCSLNACTAREDEVFTAVGVPERFTRVVLEKNSARTQQGNARRRYGAVAPQ